MPRPRSREHPPETPFARWLRGQLESLKLNVSQFATYSGLGRSTVSAWLLDGKIPLSGTQREKVAAYLKVPVALVNQLCGDATEEFEPPEYPTWLRLALDGLTEDDLRVVAATARGLREVRLQYPTSEDLRNER